jgi:hypothetical protein
MSETTPQNLKNHGRLDPLFQPLFGPVLIVNLVVAVNHLLHHRNFDSAWLVLLSLVAVPLVLKVRLYPLKVQDRIIRLEERLRLQALAPVQWHAQIYRLSEDQLIALRFAADDEVVSLAEQALEQKLDRKQIKERIKSWRADYWRV